ncbi:MAG: DUF4198 domain-containing protein [Desulfosudaceae bacterium]
MKPLKTALLTGILILSVQISGALAHMLWLTPSTDRVTPGEPVYIEIGWGHQMPRDQFISSERLETVLVLDPAGEPVKTEKIFPTFFSFTPEKKGTYLVGAAVRPGFLSITTDGHQLGNRQTVDNVVSCFRFVMSAKTMVQAGEPATGYQQKSDRKLQIIPLKAPLSLQKGDVLPVKIMFGNKPLTGATLQATHAGHNPKEQGRHKDSLWVQQIKTDDKGVANIDISNHNAWMLRVNHKTPYPDKRVCDEYSYATTLTLRPRP